MRMVSRKDFLKSLGLAGVTVVATPFILRLQLQGYMFSVMEQRMR